MSIVAQRGSMHATAVTQQGPPAVPTGQIVLQPPPEIQPSDGVSGVLANVIPMLGSVGSIVFVAVSSPGPQGHDRRRHVPRRVARLRRRQRLATAVAAPGGRRRRPPRVPRLPRRPAPDRAAGGPRPAPQRRSGTPPTPRALAVGRRGALARVGADARPRRLPVRAASASARSRCASTSSRRRRHPWRSSTPSRRRPRTASWSRTACSRTSRWRSTCAPRRCCEVAGTEQTEARGLARAIVCQLATFHSPDQLQVAVLASDRALPSWDWVKWLPHAHSTRERDAVGAARMIGTTLAEIESLLPEGLRDRPRFGPTAGETPMPHVLVVVDGGHVPVGNAHPHQRRRPRHHRARAARALGRARRPVDAALPRSATSRPTAPRRSTCCASACEPTHLAGDQLSVAGGRGDRPPPAAAAPRRRPAARRRQRVLPSSSTCSAWATSATSTSTWPGGRGCRATGCGCRSASRRRASRSRSTSRSRRSRAWARTGSSSAPPAPASPRCCARSCSRSRSPTRRRTSTSSWSTSRVARRSRAWPTCRTSRRSSPTSARSSPSSTACRTPCRARWCAARSCCARPATSPTSPTTRRPGATDRPDLAPLPALLIVADEFSELLAAKPEFVDLFVAIGRLGRSLQMHLLLSSQRLEEGRLRGLESHLSYRIGLRTFSAAESRTVLGVPDAYELPPIPGVGYLKPDPTTMVQFRASYVSGPPKGRRRRRRRPAASPPAAPGSSRSRRRPCSRRRSATSPRSSPSPTRSRSARPSTSPSRSWPAAAPPRTRCGCRRSWCPARTTGSCPTSSSTRPSAWSRPAGGPPAR